MTDTFKARPTIYRGIQMRSRLEAAFAQILDESSVDWVYEPCCYAAPGLEQYLPDFRIGNSFVEVKPPTADHKAALRKMHAILATEADAELTVYCGDYQPDGTYRWRLGARCAVDRENNTCPCDRPRPVPDRTVALSEYLGGEFTPEKMICPECRGDYLHLMHVAPNGSGRMMVKLHFSCELCPAQTTVEIYNHKGITFVETKVSAEGDFPMYPEETPVEQPPPTDTVREGAAAVARRRLAAMRAGNPDDL